MALRIVFCAAGRPVQAAQCQKEKKEVMGQALKSLMFTLGWLGSAWIVNQVAGDVQRKFAKSYRRTSVKFGSALRKRKRKKLKG